MGRQEATESGLELVILVVSPIVVLVSLFARVTRTRANGPETERGGDLGARGHDCRLLHRHVFITVTRGIAKM